MSDQPVKALRPYDVIAPLEEPVADAVTAAKLLDGQLDAAFRTGETSRVFYLMRCVLHDLETVDEVLKDGFNKIGA